MKFKKLTDRIENWMYKNELDRKMNKIADNHDDNNIGFHLLSYNNQNLAQKEVLLRVTRDDKYNNILKSIDIDADKKEALADFLGKYISQQKISEKGKNINSLEVQNDIVRMVQSIDAIIEPVFDLIQVRYRQRPQDTALILNYAKAQSKNLANEDIKELYIKDQDILTNESLSRFYNWVGSQDKKNTETEKALIRSINWIKRKTYKLDLANPTKEQMDWVKEQHNKFSTIKPDEHQLQYMWNVEQRRNKIEAVIDILTDSEVAQRHYGKNEAILRDPKSSIEKLASTYNKTLFIEDYGTSNVFQKRIRAKVPEKAVYSM